MGTILLMMMMITLDNGDELRDIAVICNEQETLNYSYFSAIHALFF